MEVGDVYAENFTPPPERLIALGEYGNTTIGEIVGSEPLTSSEFVHKLWGFILMHNLLQHESQNE